MVFFFCWHQQNKSLQGAAKAKKEHAFRNEVAGANQVLKVPMKVHNGPKCLKVTGEIINQS